MKKTKSKLQCYLNSMIITWKKQHLTPGQIASTMRKMKKEEKDFQL